jgi:hypothetical protein
MSARQKPSVNLRGPANAYAGPNERIIEFSFKDGRGGLIALREGTNGSATVEVYRVSRGVAVRGNRSRIRGVINDASCVGVRRFLRAYRCVHRFSRRGRGVD